MLVNLLVYIVMISLVTCLICGGIPFIILHLIIVIVFLSFCFLFGFVVCVFNSFFEWGPYARKSVGLYCNDLPSNLFDLWQHSFYYFAPHYRHCLFFFSFLCFALMRVCVCVFNSFFKWRCFMGQVQGLWKARNKNMSILCKEAKKLKNEFLSVEINHVLRVCEIESASLLCSMAFVFYALWHSASSFRTCFFL